MGKTQVPLTILVPFDWMDRAEVVELREKGHTILQSPAADLILAPNAHYMTMEMMDSNLLGVALKRARSSKKGKK